MKTRTIILLSVLSVLNLFDFAITSILLERHGFEAEFNIIQHWVLIQFNSIWAIFVFKVLALVGIIVASKNIIGIFAHKNVMDWILFLINIFYFGVVSWGCYLVVYNF